MAGITVGRAGRHRGSIRQYTPLSPQASQHVSNLCLSNFANPDVFAWRTEGQVRAEGGFVLRLSDHLPPLLTGPKFFPALEDEGDEEKADKSSNRGRVGASGFKTWETCFG